jgi:hypothetical protein
LNDSLFAAMRIVAHVIAADQKIDPKELNWFIWLMNTYGVDAHRRAILEQDLKHRSSIEEIHAQITDFQDRERLINWARVAMNVDGDVDPREKDLFEKIKLLNERANRASSSEYFDLAKSILQQQKESRLWEELAEAGGMLNQPIPMWGWGRYAAFSVMAQALGSGNRFAVGFVILGVLVMVFLLAISRK